MIGASLISVVVAAVAAMIVGYAWYSPMLFGNKWMKLVGKTEKDMKKAKEKMGMAMVMMFACALITAYVLGMFVKVAMTAGLGSGAMIGIITAVFAWLGFAATLSYSKVLFEDMPMDLFYIDAGHHLVIYVLMGAIFGYMG